MHTNAEESYQVGRIKGFFLEIVRSFMRTHQIDTNNTNFKKSSY